MRAEGTATRVDVHASGESIEASPRYFREGVLLVGITIGTYALYYAYAALMSRPLGPKTFGELTALLAICSIGGKPATALQLGIAHRVARAGRAERLWLEVAWTTGALVTVSVAIAYPLAVLLSIPFTTLLLVPPSLAIFTLFSASAGVLQGSMRFVEFGIAQFLSASVRIAAAVVLVTLSPSTATAFLGLLAGLVVGWAYMFRLTSRTRGASLVAADPAPERMRQTFAFTWKVLIGQVGIAALTSLDLLAIRALMPPEDAGLFGATQLFGDVVLFLPLGVVMFLFPLASVESPGPDRRKTLLRAVLGTLLLSLPVVMVYAVAAAPLTHLALGQAYVAGAQLVPWLGFAMLLMALANLSLHYLLARERYGFAYALCTLAAAQVVLIWAAHATLMQVTLVILGVSALGAIAGLSLAWRETCEAAEFP